ncbi:MAG: MarR family transcriptional regulator [Neisseriaceae bacterium]|nr:MarR family transcriptional regulator [Neisseriaceae bacterium]
MKLNPTTEQFILHWGEMGTRWGVNRTMAQIHALLFIVGRPMNAEEIVETLGVARSNVSNSIKELQNWRLVKTVPIMGDRRDHFATNDDVWALFKIIAEERMKRELEPTVAFLDNLIESPEFALENENAQTRIKETRDFVQTLSVWANDILKLPVAIMSKVLKLGAGIQKFLK